VSDRAAYLDRLAGADAFVFPSPAEGFPKVILDAFAVGLPILATRAGGPSGGLADLVAAGLVEPIARPEPDAIVAAWRRLLATDPTVVADRRRRGTAFAADHSRPAEGARLVERLRDWWPALPWGG
jgi:glycosyltransferase involved in cell wall biosynthesis